MKKIFFLVAVAVMAIVTSCNDESKSKNGSKEMNHNEKEMKNMKK